MSPKLPVISGEELIRVLKKLGYEAVRRKGSHVRLYPRDQLCLERKRRLLVEAKKLNATEEQALAEEGMNGKVASSTGS